MAEAYPSDADLNALSGTSDSEQEVLYVTTGESPYYTSFYKMLQRLIKVARRAGDLRVYKDAALTFGVRAGKFFDGDTEVNYAGATSQSLTNNQTNYIYLTAAGTLTVNTTGFPVPSVTPHVPLATILTSAGDYDGRDTSEGGDVADYRGRSIYSICGASSDHVTLVVAASDASAKVRNTADYVCDGTADDVQINAAITALAATGGVVQLSLGTFNCSSHVRLNTDDLTLRGMGPGTVLKKVAGGVATDHVVYCPNEAHHHITVEDFQIDGADIGDGTTAYNKGVFFNGNSADITQAHHFTIRRIVSHDAKAEGIVVDYSEHVLIEDCYSYNNAWAGCTFAQVKYGVMRRNHCKHNGEGSGSPSITCGINLVGVQHVQCHDNFVEDTQNVEGIALNYGDASWPVNDVDIHHNHLIENVAANSLKIFGGVGWVPKRISIHHNHVYASSGTNNGFYLDRLDGFIVCDNHLDGSGAYAIQVQNTCANGIIERNRYGANYTQGLYVYDVPETVRFGDQGTLSKTTDYTVTMYDCRKTLIAAQTSGAVLTFTLPTARNGMEYKFVRANSSAANDVRIDPSGTETIQKPDGTTGGAGKYLENTSDEIGSVSLHCRESGKWQVTESQGTWALEI